MSADVAAVIAADKATTEAASNGPWRWSERRVPALLGVKGDENYSYAWEVLEATHSGECGCRSACELDLEVLPADAKFIAAARSRWPVYIAAIEAVTEMEERFAEIGHNGHEDWEGEPECPGCVAADLRRALAVLAPSTDKEQQ